MHKNLAHLSRNYDAQESDCQVEWSWQAVSDSVLGMINALYHYKLLIIIGAAFREKLISHHRAAS